MSKGMTNASQKGTEYEAGTGISVSNGKISNTGVTSVNGSTGAVTGLATTSQVNAKQNTLSSSQLSACNSGITSTLVGYIPQGGTSGQVWTSDGSGGGYWSTITTVTPISNLSVTFSRTIMTPVGDYYGQSWTVLSAISFDKNISENFNDGLLKIHTKYTGNTYVKDIGSNSYNKVSDSNPCQISIPASILNKGGGNSDVFCQKYSSTTSNLMGIYINKIYNNEYEEGYDSPPLNSPLDVTLTLSTGEVYHANIILL